MRTVAESNDGRGFPGGIVLRNRYEQNEFNCFKPSVGAGIVARPIKEAAAVEADSDRRVFSADRRRCAGGPDPGQKPTTGWESTLS